MNMQAVCFVWDGGAMIPLERFRRLASQQFRPGHEYALVPHQERSDREQGLYFACIKTTWENLRESDQKRFPSAEHLRKWCLFKEGFASEHTMVCDSDEKAKETAALARFLDGFAIIKISGPIVYVWTALSQSKVMMGHDTFHDSVNKVLERCAHMLGISVNELTENAKSQMQRRA
jgi:hypothetical protein